MALYIPRGLGSRFTTLLHSFAQDDPGAGPFASALTEEQIQQAVAAEGVTFGADEDCVFTPHVALWAFVIQCVSGSKELRCRCGARHGADWPRWAASLVRRPRAPIARRAQKLPEGFLRRLTYQVGVEVEDQAPAGWRWHNRRTCSSTARKPSPTTPGRIKRSIRNRPLNGRDWDFP